MRKKKENIFFNEYEKDKEKEIEVKDEEEEKGKDFFLSKIGRDFGSSDLRQERRKRPRVDNKIMNINGS